MPALTREELLQRFRALNTWKRAGVRAPHKPLLVLLALSRLREHADRLMRYASLDEPLADLLRRFGPPRGSYHPEYPFWHLQSDRVWEVPDASSYVPKEGGSSPTRTELLAQDARAGFPADAYRLLRKDPGLVRKIAQELLEEHFPESAREELLEALGLDLGAWCRRTPRDPAFRAEVLQAYSRACAVCGFDGHLTSGPFGLDAAHVKWKQAGGPDEVSNGISMCVLHHRAFDRGAITIETDLSVSVSADLTGSMIRPLFTSLHGRRMRLPHAERHYPRREFLTWHHAQVFHRPAVGR